MALPVAQAFACRGCEQPQAYMADLSLRVLRRHRRCSGRRQKGRYREDKGRVVGRPMGGSVSRPAAGCWPRLHAVRREAASRCSGTVCSPRSGRVRRAHSPVVGALGAANHPFPSTAGPIDGGPLGAKQRGAVAHDATDNAAGSARSLASRAATGTADHSVLSITVLHGRDDVSITGRATDNAAKPSNSAWPDCWRAAVSDADHALNFAGRAIPGSDGRGPISPVTAADARGSRYVGRQPPAGPRDAASPGVFSRACGRDLRAADARI